MGFRIPYTGFQSVWNLDSGFLSGIPDSLSCIPGSKAQNFGFHEQTFFRVPDSTGKNFTNSGIQVSAHGANDAVGQSGHNCIFYSYSVKPIF